MTNLSNQKMSNDGNPTEIRHRRPRPIFRFSLRSFMLAVFVCCLTIGAWSVFINPFRMQWQAIELVGTLDGKMTLQNASGPSWHAWLVTTLLGDNAFVEVRTLDLRDTKVTDDHLATIGAMRHLREIQMDRCAVSDAGIEQLSGLTQLETVSLRYTQISNAGLIAFSSMPNLRCLRLTGTEIDDNGLVSPFSSNGIE